MIPAFLAVLARLAWWNLGPNGHAASFSTSGPATPERLGRLCRTLRLTVTDVWVTGLFHDTTAILRWDATQDLPDGSTCTHHGVHVVELRWLRIVSIDANDDSQAVERALSLFAAHGVAEAAAAPITS